MPKTSPHHIALFYRSIGGGGAERVLVNLARGFAKRGLKTDLVLCQAGGPHMWQVSPEVRVVDLEAPRMLPSFFKLAEYLRQEQPAVMLTTLHFTSEIALWAKRFSGAFTQIVVCEQNTLSREARYDSRLRYRFTPLCAKWFYPWADGIVAASHGVAKDLAQITSLPLERIQVIYNPVITPELAEMATEPLEHPWFDQGEPAVILGAGRLQDQKDFPTLIRAFAEVRRKQKARLAILGWGPNRPQLEALVEEMGLENDVAMLGHVKNPFAYMARAAVFVLSSAWEGFGNVLVEAMAVGTPVVSTDCQSGPAEILDNGKYGLLTPVGNSNALAKAILQVLSGNSQQIDPDWLKQFTLEVVTQQYLEVLGVT